MSAYLIICNLNVIAKYFWITNYVFETKMQYKLLQT